MMAACNSTTICSNSTLCADGYTGIGCSECAPGLVRSYDAQCNLCSSGSSFVAGISSLAVCSLLLLIAVVAYLLVLKQKSVVAADAAAAADATKQGTKTAVKTAVSSTSTVRLKTDPQWRCQAAILLSYLQVLTAITVTCSEATFPSNFKSSTESATSVFNLDITTVLSFVSCIFSLPFFQKFILTTMAPYAAFVAVYVGWFTAWMWSRSSSFHSRTISPSSIREEFLGRADRLLWRILMLLHPGVSIRLLQLLKCRDVCGTLRLEHDTSVMCWTHEHFSYIAVGTVVFITYVAFFPLYLLYTMYKHRAHLHHVPRTNTTSTQEEKSRTKTTTKIALPTAQELPEGWAGAIDPSTNRTYYFNRVTQQNVWTFPGEVPEEAGGEWKHATDPKTGNSYIYNRSSGETKWRCDSERNTDSSSKMKSLALSTSPTSPTTLTSFSTPQHRSIFLRFGSVYRPYSQKSYFWGMLVVINYKMFLVSVVGVLFPGHPAQFGIAFFVVLLYGIVCFKWKPYAGSNANRLNMLCIVALCATYLIGFWIQIAVYTESNNYINGKWGKRDLCSFVKNTTFRSREEEEEVVTFFSGVGILLLAISLFPVVFYCTTFSLLLARRPCRNKEKTEKEENNVPGTACSADGPDVLVELK